MVFRNDEGVSYFLCDAAIATALFFLIVSRLGYPYLILLRFSLLSPCSSRELPSSSCVTNGRARPQFFMLCVMIIISMHSLRKISKVNEAFFPTMMSKGGTMKQVF